MLNKDADESSAAPASAEAGGSSLASRPPLPLGTVAFLATDIEGSTTLGKTLGEDRFALLLEWHHALLRAEFAQASGIEFHEAGDGFFVVFTAAKDALRCAHACQQALTVAFVEQDGGEPRLVRVRMAIHVADIKHLDRPETAGASYRGMALHDIARLLSAANGGQIFLSEAAEAVLRRNVPEGVQLADRGIYHLRDAPTPEHIFEAQWGDVTSETSPAPRASQPRTPILPTEFTRFFGRDEEIQRIVDALSRGGSGGSVGSGGSGGVRLLTLTGIGGSGKTRLAIEAARTLARDFAGAVWFVPMLGTLDPARLPDALRAVVAPTITGEAWEALAGVLATAPCLLVLDNLEHLLGDSSNDATADFVQTLLERFPRLYLLVTSRQRVGIAAEQEFAVRPLPTPKAALRGASAPTDARTAMGFASIALFEDRARRARFDFEVTDRNAAAVMALCARLEGIPLALELAAAWARLLTPAEMLTQFDDIRRSRDRKLPDRHRSLDAAIEGSYRLLDDNQQAVFRALSVFQGGWTLAAARAVCDDPMALTLLADLRDRSLLVVDEHGDDSRYRFLETVRAFAAARLDENLAERDDALRRHTDWYAALAAKAEDALRGPEQATWLDRLSDEHRNLAATLHRADRSTRLQIATHLERYWTVRGYLSEGRAWLADALSAEGNDIPSPASHKAVNVAGILALTAGDTESALPLFVAYTEGCRTTGDESGFGVGSVNIAIAASMQGDFAQARAAYESTLELWHRLEKRKVLATVLSNLGAVCSEQNDHDAALRYLDESLEQQNEDDDTLMRANTLTNLANVSIKRSDVAAATGYTSECLKLRIALADRTGFPNFFYLLAGLKQCAGDLSSAAWWYGAVDAACSHVGTTFHPTYRALFESDRQALREACDEKIFEDASRAGRAASWEQMILTATHTLHLDVLADG